MKAFIDKLRALNFSLAVDKDKLVLKGNKDQLTDEEIAAIRQNTEIIGFIKENKEALIAYLLEHPEEPVKKQADNVLSIYPLSGLQEGFLFHGLYDAGSGVYNQQFCCDFTGLDTGVFEAAWNRLLHQHTILRSGFYYDAFRIPVQCVYREAKVTIAHHDFRHLEGNALADALEHYTIDDRKKPFEFKTPPLMRISLLRLNGDECYRMVWSANHIIFDGWSLPVMMEEFLETYEALITGNPVPAREIDYYEDYIRYIEKRDKTGDARFWQQYLTCVSGSTLLPFISATTERTKGEGSYTAFEIKPAATHILSFVKQRRITVNTLIQGVWALLLSRYTGNTSVTYGVTVSGRPDDLPGVEKKVGMYINMLPLHTTIPADQPVIDWLLQLQQGQVDSREHQYNSLNDIQRWIGVSGNLFDSFLVFENYPVNELLATKSWRLQPDNVMVHDHPNYPLAVAVNSSDTISITFKYNTALLTAAWITEIAGNFKQVLENIITHADAPLKNITLLTSDGRQQLLETFNDTAVPYPADKNILQLFAAQVEQQPTAPALVFENMTLSYQELDTRSNQLAHYLLQEGVTPECLVPVYLERGPDLIIAILGILKAGAAYLPVDVTYPAERVAYLLKDSGAVQVVTSRDLLPQLSFLEHIYPIIPDAAQEMPAVAPDIVPTPRSLAYVIYTSGSTGKPKGVMVEHGGVANLALSQARALRLKPGMRSLQFAAAGFDASCYEIFNTLLSGGCLVLATREALLSVQAFGRLVQQQQVDVATLPPSYLHNVRDQLGGIRTIVSAGEALNRDDAQYVQQKGIRLINAYGPTECTVCASLSDTPLQGDSIVIGKPIDNVQIYIVDADGELCAVGVAGEICIAGAGLARGYLYREALTAEKFVPNPFAAGRMYRSGDLARWCPDGNIEYLGRMDEQVKVRGHRIELGEITAVLQEAPGVQQAVVLMKDTQLTGYLVTGVAWHKETVLQYMREQLPEYMLPAVLLSIPAIPLTPNGKIDKKALLQLTHTPATVPYEPARNGLEASLVKIWEELLEVERIGIHDDFFERGGHSLLAMRLIAAIREVTGREVPIRDVFDYPTIRQLAVCIAGGSQRSTAPLTQQPRTAHIPLSFSQERIWFIDQLQGSVHYHIPWLFRIKGHPDMEALQRAFRQVINRHEVLRTVIRQPSGNGIPYQEITAMDQWQWHYTSIHDLHMPLEDYISRVLFAPFDLEKDAMIQVHMVQLSDTEYQLIMVLHHIAFDGWSVSILVKELAACYRQQEATLPALSVQYADYAIWQRNYLQGTVLEQQLSYWRQQLKQVTPLELPLDHARPAGPAIKGAEVRLALNRDCHEQLMQLANREGCTLFMVMLTVFKILLYRYSGQQDICIGTSVAGRRHKELENLIGFFINALALRSRLQQELTFRELLQQVKNTTLDAYEHQDVPFAKVVEALGVPVELNRNPVFQVMFAVQNTPETADLILNDFTLSPETPKELTAQFDLSLDIFEGPEGLTCNLRYCSALFSEATATRLLDHYHRLLLSALQQPGQRIGVLDMLSAYELEQLSSFHGISLPYSPEITAVTLFADQMAATPDAVAVSFEGTDLRYHELDERSNALAHLLQAKGAVAESRVGICLERSPEMIISILAVMKAGAAYVPIDPAYPPDRVAYVLKDAGIQLLITQHGLLSALPEVTIILTDEMNGATATAVVHTPAPHHPAYIIYTSGSTGEPKGVKILHSGLAASTLARKAYYGQVPSWLLVPSFAFDSSVGVIFGALTTGSRLILCRDAALKEPDVIKTLLSAVSGILCVPSYYRFLLEEGLLTASPQVVILAGEKLDKGLVQRHFTNFDRPGKIYNEYGPTEFTVWASVAAITGSNTPVTIGYPVANSSAWIVNNEGQLLPPGIPGELLIGGPQVAGGYLGRPALTAQKFIPDIFGKTAGNRLYKTGDLVRWLPDGQLEYIGRTDDQVKIRGFRIEPGEIAHVLEQLPGVSQAVVLVREDTPGNKQLVAYFTGQHIPDTQPLLDQLKARLPEYMVPAVLIPVPEIPLTPNGKVDKKALLQISLSASGSRYESPRNELEAAIAAIWSSILEVERVGIYDNFFSLGGHSLLAVRMVAAIRRELEREITIRDVFNMPTIAELATAMDKALQQDARTVITAQVRPARIPLSFSQERIWFADQLQGSLQYHMPWVFRLKGALNLTALERAFIQIVNRHEVLRTVFREENGMPYQEIGTAGRWQMTVKEQATLNMPLEDYIRQVVEQPFALQHDAMLRVQVIKMGEDDHQLIIVLHHIAFDGWSAAILIKELETLYRGYTTGIAPELPAPALQYADYALWQRNTLAHETLAQQLAFWKEQLAETAALELITDRERPLEPGIEGHTVVRLLHADCKNRLTALSDKEGCTLFMTLLAVFKVLLHRRSGQEDICVGTPIAGRQQQETEGMIGMFVNTLALRTAVQGSMPFSTLLQQVKQTAMAAYEHQETPFDKVVESLGVLRDMSRHPLFQVMFSLQNAPDATATELGSCTLIPAAGTITVSMFDISMNIIPDGDRLVLSLTCNTALFDHDTAVQLLQEYQQLLEAVLAQPDTIVGRLRMLPEAEEAALLQLSAQPATAPFSFMEQLRKVLGSGSGVTAIIYHKQQLNYAALGTVVNEVAAWLHHQGIVPGSRIVLLGSRSDELLIVLLGILHSGGVYVPIDMTMPADRVRYIIEDVQPQLVITAGEPPAGITAVSLSGLIAEARAEEHPWQPPILHAHDPAYIIYTSGSTGYPKGVLVKHGNLDHLFGHIFHEFVFRKPPVWPFLASHGFDISLFQIFTPLLQQGTIIVADKQDMENMDGLIFILQSCTILDTVPALYRLLLKQLKQQGIQQLTHIQRLFIGGDLIEDGLLYELSCMFPQAVITVLYGPTEGTIFCTSGSYAPGTVLPETNGRLIGKPLAGGRVFIMGEELQLQPNGVAGEICIGGQNVAAGYWYQPELTSRQFVDNPYGTDKLYRTGDIGCRQADGSIRFMGRRDGQIKIHGHRIETGEVENALQKAPGIRQAVVLASPDKQGIQRLIAYVVPVSVYNRDELTAWLQEKLPVYMIPGVIIPLESVPLTANGKIDRKALPAPETIDNGTSYVPPRNPVENTLANIWQDLLGVQHIGIYDNFFELGGDSIITIQVVSRCRKNGIHLQPRDLFIHQTIAGLHHLLQGQHHQNNTTEEQGILTGNSGLLPVQQQFFEGRGGNISHYNQSILLEIAPHITLVQLTAALQQLVAHHDALRFRYSPAGESWQQTYEEIPFYPDTEIIADNDAISRVCEHYQASLDITEGRVFRAVCIQLPSTADMHRLLLVAHHLVVDGVSWRIITEDLQHLLEGGNSLGAKTASYRQWHTALQQYAAIAEMPAQLNYWQHITDSHESWPAVTGTTSVADMEYHQVQLDAGVTRALLQDAAKTYGTGINDLLLGALISCLHETAGMSKVVIGMEGHGREQFMEHTPDVSRTVGWFTTVFPVLLEMPGQPDKSILIRQIKDTLRQIPEKGIGYGVLRYLSGRLSGAVPWNIMFNYLGQLDHVIAPDGLLRPAAEHAGSQMDTRRELSHQLDLTCAVADGQLVCTLSYSRHVFTAARIAQLAAAYLKALTDIIHHCITATAKHSPADFGLAGVVQVTELDRFLSSRPGVQSLYRLSGLQEGLLFHGVYDHNSNAYIEQMNCNFTGLDLHLFKACWRHLLQQHSILRSAFFYDTFRIPVQAVFDQVEMPLEIAGEDELEAYIEADRTRPFDFSKPPLMRIGLFRLPEDTYRMVWTSHHIIFDGWSLPVLMEEFMQTYEALLHQQQPAVVEEDRYEDYIRYMEKRSGLPEEQYWKKYLSGFEPGGVLPFAGKTSTREQTGDVYQTVELHPGAAISAQAMAYCRHHRITINTLMQGIWAYLLYRYTSNREVVFGVTVSGRPDELPGVEKRVGLYINTLPLRTQLQPLQEIAVWLQELQQQQLASREYQYTALTRIRQWAGIKGELFDSLVVFENYPLSEMLNTRHWSLQAEIIDASEQSNYPLTITMAAGAELYIAFKYNAALLQENDMQLLGSYMKTVLEKIISDTVHTIMELDSSGISKAVVPAEEDMDFFDFGNQ